MTGRQLEIAAYIVLGLGTGITWIAVAHDLSPFGGPTRWQYVWMTLPFGLALASTRWLRRSAKALRVLVPTWTVCSLGGAWVTLDASFFVVSDMSGLVLFAPPIVQIPVVLAATLAGWGLQRHERM